MGTIRIKRLCQIPTCGNEATCGRFCKEHYKPRKTHGQRKETNSNRAGYTYRWQQARKIFLMTHPLCVRCGEPATDVDHIIPHRGDMALFWDRDNWQPLCHRCHSIKTATEDGGWGRQPKRHATTAGTAGAAAAAGAGSPGGAAGAAGTAGGEPHPTAASAASGAAASGGAGAPPPPGGLVWA